MHWYEFFASAYTNINSSFLIMGKGAVLEVYTQTSLWLLNPLNDAGLLRSVALLQYDHSLGKIIRQRRMRYPHFPTLILRNKYGIELISEPVQIHGLLPNKNHHSG